MYFDKLFAHDLVDCRFQESRADGVVLPVSLAEVREELAFVANVSVEVGEVTQ